MSTLEKQSKLLTLAVLVLVVFSTASAKNRLASEKAKKGSFCDQLRYLLILGTTGFRAEQLTGEAIASEYYRGNVVLKGATECYIYHDKDGIYPEFFSCTFGDESSLDPTAMATLFQRIDDQVDSCLAGTVWPGFFYFGEPSPRFFRGERHRSDTLSDYIDRSDEQAQSVSVMIVGPGAQSENYVPRMKVQTIVVAVEAKER